MAVAKPPAGWRRSLPAALLAAYFVAMPIQFQWPDAYRQIAPADLLLAAYLVIRLPQLRHAPAAWTMWHFALLPLLAFGMIVAAVRTGEITAYALLQKGLGLLILFALFACLVDFARDWDRLQWIMRTFVGAVLLHASVALMAQVMVYLGGPVIPLINEPHSLERISGLVLDPNAFGGLVALAFVLHHLTAGTPSALLPGAWAWIGYLVLPTTLLLTFSRSAWLGLAIGLFTVALLRPGHGGRALLTIVVPTAIVAPLVLAVIPNSVDLATRAGTIASRVVLDENALTGFLRNSLTGMGLGVYVEKYGIVVHNTTLWFLSDLGGIGLAVFLGLLATVTVRLVMTARIAPPDRRPLALALLCGHALMFGLSLGIEAFYQRHWWIVLAGAGAAYALATSPDPAEQKSDERVSTR